MDTLMPVKMLISTAVPLILHLAALVLEARVDLSRASGGGNSLSPTWRLVSVLCDEQVDGGTALGQDPLVDVAANPNDASS